MGSCQWVPLNKDKVRRPKIKTITQQIKSFNNLQRRLDCNSRISRVEDYIYDSEEEPEEDIAKHSNSSENGYNSVGQDGESEMERDVKDVHILKKNTKTKQSDALQETAIENKKKRIVKQHLSPPIKWERGDLIGSGAYGKVYQGLNLNNGRLIAIKSVQIGSKKTATRELMALKYEVSILRELDHPHVVNYIFTDADPIKKRVDILLEYVPGGSLSSLLKKFGAFNEKITKIYLLQMLDALTYIHEKGIVHRDLKWANVLINNDASIRVSDFGASKKLIRTKDKTGYEPWKSLKGSPYWLAPEVACREGHDTSVDIWSLGCCTIEMLTGRPPWSDRSKKASKVVSLIKNPKESITIPKELSDEWYDFIFQSCLQRDPQKRWTAKELVHHPYLKKRLSSNEINQSSIEIKFTKKRSIKRWQDDKNSSITNNGIKDSAVPGPSVINSVDKANMEDDKAEENEDNAYKTNNFSRWSDTQFDEGTCSLSFLKLCKTEEEKARMMQLERLKLEKLLRWEIQKKEDDKIPFKVSEHEGEHLEQVEVKQL